MTIAPFTASNAAGRGMAERLGGAVVREASATPGLWMATASAGSGGRRLEGWVDGNGTRVQVRLLDAAGGDPLWTARYDDADDGAGTLAARIVADLLAATSLHAELYEPPCTRSCTR